MKTIATILVNNDNTVKIPVKNNLDEITQKLVETEHRLQTGRKNTINKYTIIKLETTYNPNPQKTCTTCGTNHSKAGTHIQYVNYTPYYWSVYHVEQCGILEHASMNDEKEIENLFNTLRQQPQWEEHVYIMFKTHTLHTEE